jgi:hypothetical protein
VFGQAIAWEVDSHVPLVYRGRGDVDQVSLL